MSSLDQAVQTQLNNIQKKTGKSLDDLAAIVKKSGLNKHGEIRKVIKTPEKGVTTAEIDTQFVPNFLGDIKFKFKPTTNIKRIPLTATQVNEFTCLPASNFERQAQLEVFQEQLLDQWDSNVRRTLSNYDRVE